MKRRPLAIACIAVLALGLSSARGAEMRTIAVFSFSGYQRLADDIAALGNLGGSPLPGFELPALLANYLRQKTDVESLQGIDPQRPVGAVVTTDGLAVVPVLFVPVKDLQALFASLEKLIDKPRRQKNGLWKIGRKTATGFVRQQDGWAFLAQSEDDLRRLPDPGKLLGPLPKKFDAAFQFNFTHVPEVFRTMAIDFIRLAMRNNLARREGETVAAHALRKRAATWRFRVLEHLLTDSQQITFGWSLDEKTKQAAFDLRLVPVPESRMARQLASLRKTKTRFGSLGTKHSPLSFHVNWALDQPQIQSIAADVQASRDAVIQRIGEFAWIKSPEERKTFQQVADTVLDVLHKTIQTGHVDLAMAVDVADAREAKPREKSDLETRPLTMVAAAYVGQGKPLRQAFEAVARLGKKDARFARLQLDVAKVKGTPVHAIVFPSDRRQITKRLFGDELKLYVAVSTDSMFGAIGPDALAALERAITPKPIEVAPLHLTVKLSTLTDVVGRMTGQSTLTGLAGRVAGDDDHVTLTIQADGRGLHARAVAGEGVLRLGATGLMLALLFGA